MTGSKIECDELGESCPDVCLDFDCTAAVVTVTARMGWFPSRYESLAIISAALVGMVRGRRRVRFMCSNLKCGARLQLSTTECPGCGGAVAGTIRSLNERLEAEEQHRASRTPELE